MPSYLKSSNSGFYVNDIPGITFELIDDIKQEKTFNNYVQDIHNSELTMVMQRFVDRQKKKLNTKELLSSATMIQRHNDLSRTISKGSRFVGYAITPRESKSININIKSVGFQATSSDSFTLYLFDPSQQTAMKSSDITITGKSLTWTDLDWDIEFDLSGGTAGGSYLIGYFEDDATASLYEQDWSDGQAHAAKRITCHYAGIAPVRMSASGSTLPNMQRLPASVHCLTSGFDLRFTIKCDITDVLVDNIPMFGEAVQHAIAIRYLRDALTNHGMKPIFSGTQTRENFQEMLIDLEGMLYGGIIEGQGYKRGIIDNLAIDFSNLDAVCLKAKEEIIRKVSW